MRRSTRKSSMGIGLGEEKCLNSNPTGSFGSRFSLSPFVKRVEKLTEDQKNAIKKVGFGNLLLIPNRMLSKNLLVELMDRWDSEERGFMLLPGMIKITLMDVALILGIRVTGDPILPRDDESFSDLESDFGASLWKRNITVASLEERLDSLGEVANEDFVRTFLLFTIGTLLFPNPNGKVDSRYLYFLKNLDNIDHIAWGAAVLEDLFMWLTRRKESNVQYVGGCLILLQVWSFEHIDLGRPDLIDSNLMFPRACRWESSRSHQRRWFSAKFRELKDHQITWQLQPTYEELEFDVISELLEVESSSIDNSSDGSPITGVVGPQYIPEMQTMGLRSTSCASVLHGDQVELSSQCQKSGKLTSGKVVGLHLESEVTNSCKIQVEKGQEVHLKQSTTSLHIPEVETEAIEFPSTCASKLCKEFAELSSECQTSEKLNCGDVVGLHLESDWSSTSKVQNGQVLNLNQSASSQHLPEVQTESISFPSTPCVSKLQTECGKSSSQCHNSDKSKSGSEELIERNRILEVEKIELRKEIEALKAENRELKMHISSTNDMVSRLEGLVMDETYYN